MRRTMQSSIVLAFAVLVPAHARAGWTAQTLAGTAVEVYTPESASPTGDGRALFVILHGCGQTAAVLRTYGNLEATAEALGLVVALPDVPNGGVLAGCWDYYGPGHARTDPHEAAVLGVSEALADDPAYAIDPAQVYLAGLSSGGGLALVLGCLAPERFAGLVIAAGPSLGTTALEIFTVSTTTADALELCTAYADTNAGAFLDQLAVTFTDALDLTVAQGYAAINAEMFAVLYAEGDALERTSFDLASAPGSDPVGTGEVLADADGPRIARLVSGGIGHNWPSGSGETPPVGSFVAGTGIDLTRYAAEFFAANNRRVTVAEGGSTGSTSEGTTGALEDESSEGTTDTGSAETSTTSGDAATSGTSTVTEPPASASEASGAPNAGDTATNGCQCHAATSTGPAAWLLPCLAPIFTGPRRRRSRST